MTTTQDRMPAPGATPESPLFDPYSVPCGCMGPLDEDCCPCADAQGVGAGAERVLRHIVHVGGKLTDRQREWCMSEINKVEGHCSADVVQADDATVAAEVLCAWLDYCRDKGML